MNLHRYQNPAEFLQLAQPYLETQEAHNNLILGVALHLHERPDRLENPPYMAVVIDAVKDTVNDAVEGDGRVVLTAVITPPLNLLIAADPHVDPQAFTLLIDNLRREGPPFPGVNAESSLSLRFAEAWSSVTGASYSLRMRLRCYQLRQVFPPDPLPPGHLHPSTMNDLDLLTAWWEAFSRESIHEEPPPGLRQTMLRRIETGSLHIWDDHGPVSMAAAVRPTAHTISITGVYTPPVLRCRGYASACVAALSQRQLDLGFDSCLLFTDLDYPTSNAIYQKIGYRPVCDFMEYAFK